MQYKDKGRADCGHDAESNVTPASASSVIAKTMEESGERLSSNEKNFESLEPDSPGANDEDYTTFSRAERRGIMFFVCMAGLFSPLSALIYFPSLEYISHDLHVSIQLMNLTITTYLIVQGFIPSILGDLADQFGRRPVYLLALALYFGANIGLALQNSYPALLLLRMVQNAGSSGGSCSKLCVNQPSFLTTSRVGTIALGFSVVSDIAPPHVRGKYVGISLLGYGSA
jgi:MFS family permease